MDDGLLHRVANLCKGFYTVNEIDSLFIYAGAKAEWRIDDSQTLDLPNSPFHNSSVRFRHFYSWVEGIKAKSPTDFDKLTSKVILEVSSNEQIPESERNYLCKALGAIEEVARTSGEGIDLEALLSTLARALKNSGHAREVAILAGAEPHLDWFSRDSFSDTDNYYLTLAIPYRLFEQIAPDKEASERIIQEHIWPLLSAIRGETISSVQIV
jgi:hypothetical protein